MRKVNVLLAGALLIGAACSTDGGNDEEVSAGEGAPVEETSPDVTPQPAEPTPDATETVTAAVPAVSQPDGWVEINPAAPWAARAGLSVVELGSDLYLLGGRTPNDSAIPGDSELWGDVWVSSDKGVTWEQILETDDSSHWPARAYFRSVVKDEQIFVLGGQNFTQGPNPFCELFEQGLTPPPGIPFDPDAPCPEFLPQSDFFNDVWSSPDGVTWTEMTAAASWEARAGLSVAVLGDYIYVMGGSQNDDAAFSGSGGPQRIYFNDVWRSSDGKEWELVTEAAPWDPRAGAVLIVKDGQLLLAGGEQGFTCEPLPDCDPPYFNDVWSSTDGSTWELVTEAAGWSNRPGHACDVISDLIYCFGGFGLAEAPMDIWSSPDGAIWSQVDSVPWDAADQSEIKYDFAWVAVGAGPDGLPSILTFGGDRETFHFTDPENYLRVDNDAWSFDGG